MEQILLEHGIYKEIVAAIMVLNKTQSKCLLIGWRHNLLWKCYRYSARAYTNPISVHNLLWLRTSNFDGSNERKWFHTKKARCTWYIAQTLTDPDDAVDIALLANTPSQAEYLLQAALASMWMQIKRSTRVLIKKKTYPL